MCSTVTLGWGEFVVAVQCKRYSKPIGNKAVQEVFTGAKNIGADAAAVIGTGGFTRSSMSLSSSTLVELIDASEIQFFSERFGFVPEIKRNVDEATEIYMAFQTLPQRMLALAFRTVLIQFDVTDLNIDLGFKHRFFEEVDETGGGSMSFEQNELASLLIYSNVIFSATFKLSVEIVEALKKHDYPNLDNLREGRLNDTVKISDLYGVDVAADLKNEFLAVARRVLVDLDLSKHSVHSL